MEDSLDVFFKMNEVGAHRDTADSPDFIDNVPVIQNL